MIGGLAVVVGEAEAVVIEADRVRAFAILVVTVRHRTSSFLITFRKAVTNRRTVDRTVVHIATRLVNGTVRQRRVMLLVETTPFLRLSGGLRSVLGVLTIQMKGLPVTFEAEIIFLGVGRHGGERSAGNGIFSGLKNRNKEHSEGSE
jgi:hypothetical protein